MKASAVTVSTSLLLLAAGCSTVSTKYDYVKTYDFSQLHTFGWLPDRELPDVDPSVVRRVEGRVAAELAAKGYREATDPDFLLVLYAGTEVKSEEQAVGYAINTTGPLWGPAGVVSYEYEEGTLVIDVVDARRHELVWRGMGKSDLDPNQTQAAREGVIDEAVAAILKNFPPPTGS